MQRDFFFVTPWLLQTQNGFDAALLGTIPEEAEPPFILFLRRFDIYLKGLDRLAAGLEKLIGDSALRRRLGTDAREWASRFTWDGIALREREWLDQSPYSP